MFLFCPIILSIVHFCQNLHNMIQQLLKEIPAVHVMNLNPNCDHSKAPHVTDKPSKTENQMICQFQVNNTYICCI